MLFILFVLFHIFLSYLVSDSRLNILNRREGIIKWYNCINQYRPSEARKKSVIKETSRWWKLSDILTTKRNLAKISNHIHSQSDQKWRVHSFHFKFHSDFFSRNYYKFNHIIINAIYFKDQKNQPKIAFLIRLNNPSFSSSPLLRSLSFINFSSLTNSARLGDFANSAPKKFGRGE